MVRNERARCPTLRLRSMRRFGTCRIYWCVGSGRCLGWSRGDTTSLLLLGCDRPRNGIYMSVDITGIPVAAGIPVDVSAVNAQVVTGTPLSETSVQRRAQSRAQQLTAAPTPESKQKSLCDLLTSALTQGLFSIVVLATYYRDDWADRYCETDIAEFFLVFGLLGLASVCARFLIDIWFWRIIWDTFVKGSQATQKRILKTLWRLTAPIYCVIIAFFVWFIVGETRIWATHGCSDEEYALIVNGSSPVRAHRSTLHSRSRSAALTPRSPSYLRCHALGRTASTPTPRGRIGFRVLRPLCRPIRGASRAPTATAAAGPTSMAGVVCTRSSASCSLGCLCLAAAACASWAWLRGRMQPRTRLHKNISSTTTPSGSHRQGGGTTKAERRMEWLPSVHGCSFWRMEAKWI